ncbi:hypothetical protein SDC9_200076 [bioreactor metagenome]|uniref:Uncharacterized protein n=1 Tax=bioreactor metagenome TaxID=1076179 RepID=A0A645IM66_9ZZZZ
MLGDQTIAQRAFRTVDNGIRMLALIGRIARIHHHLCRVVFIGQVNPNQHQHGQ